MEEERIKLGLTKNINGIEVEYGKLPQGNLQFYFRTRGVEDVKLFEGIINTFLDKIIQQQSEPNHGVEWRVVEKELVDRGYLKIMIVTFEIHDVY